MKPIVFLDVDGVVVVEPSPGEPHLKNSWTNWKYTEILDSPLIYSPDLIDALNALNDRVEVRVLSSWLLPEPGHKRPIDLLLPALGLDSFTLATPAMGTEDPNVRSEIMPKDKRWWKLNNVMDSMDAEKRPVIWLDNDIRRKTSGKFIATYAKDLDLPFLSIPPSELKGLAPSDILRVNNFIDTLM